MTTTSLTDQLNHLWRTRPIRLPAQGPGAGVAAGVAYRYGVDPILIRVAFVVATVFGGAGVVLYLVGWLLFTQPGDQVSPLESLFGKGRSALSQKKTIVLGVVLIVTVSAMGPMNIGFHGTGLIGLAALLGGWWLLYQRHPKPPPAPVGSEWGEGLTFADSTTSDFAPGFGTASGTAAGPATPSQGWIPQPRAATTEAASEPEVQDATPPSWDPLGAARFAWDRHRRLPRRRGFGDRARGGRSPWSASRC